MLRLYCARSLPELGKNQQAREKNVLDILGEIQHLDIDRVFLYIWNEDSLSQPWMVWGYKER
jgi:hypothetical protein